MDVDREVGLRQRLELLPGPFADRAVAVVEREAPVRAGRTGGVGPADSTGKSLTRCWPGGTRAAVSLLGRGRESRAKSVTDS